MLLPRLPSRPASTRIGRMLPPALLAVVGLAACDSSTGPEDSESVAIRFVAAETSTGGAAAGGLDLAPVVGTNGSLEITDLRMIVAELEFEGSNGTCGINGDDDDEEDCFEVELPPRLVDVPLDGAPLTIATAELPAGVYREFELEVEDLEDDEDDSDFAGDIATLATEIRSAYPEWPEEGTIRVEGTFTPNGGTPESFVVWIDGEVEVELELVPPLDIPAAEGDAHTLDIVLYPERWFVRENGTVIDLTQWDYATTGELLELEVEIEDGFEVELDDD